MIYFSHIANQMTKDQLDGSHTTLDNLYSDKDWYFHIYFGGQYDEVKVYYPSFNTLPKSIKANIYGSLRSSAGICLIIQLLSGVYLVMHYPPHIDHAFSRPPQPVSVPARGDGSLDSSSSSPLSSALTAAVAE